MNDSKLLNQEELQEIIRELDGWQLKQGSIKKEWSFKDFIEAFGFMSKVALISESMNHHPNFYNVYNTLIIELSTHDSNGVTHKDIILAKAINKL